MGFFKTLKGVIYQVFGKKEVEEKLDVQVAISNAMGNAVDLWSAIYAGRAPWIDKDCKTMGLGAAIASTFAMMATVEFESDVDDALLNADYQRVIRHIREYAEYGCAKGGLAAKPFIDDGGNIAVDVVQAEYFMPTDYDTNGRIIGAVFVDKHTSGKNVYTRTEQHQFSGGRYTIINRAFLKENVLDYTAQNDFGREVPLSSVERWERIEPFVAITDVERPLFAYFKVPGANAIDPHTPIGASVYAGAVDQLREADEQWSRILWEYKAKEAAIFADLSVFPPQGPAPALGLNAGGSRFIADRLPKGDERLYKLLNLGGDQKNQIDPYSPDIRDESLFHGLDQMLKRIEYNVGLSFGTLSDPVNVDKTATEIVSSKQRMYTTVRDIQKALQDFLEDLVYAIAAKKALAGTNSNMDYDISFKWDDSLIVDTQAEQIIRMNEVNAGLVKPERYIMWRYGVSEEEAREMMPEPETGNGTSAIDQVMANWAGGGGPNPGEA